MGNSEKTRMREGDILDQLDREAGMENHARFSRYVAEEGARRYAAQEVGEAVEVIKELINLVNEFASNSEEQAKDILRVQGKGIEIIEKHKKSTNG